MPGKMARSDPRPSVRVTRGAGSGQHLASVLQEARENANIDAGLGFIWRVPALMLRERYERIALMLRRIYYYYRHRRKKRRRITAEERERYVKDICANRPAIQRLVIDSNDCITDMCVLGVTSSSDKSPLNVDNRYRHAYTPIYGLLFTQMKNRPIDVAEIGIGDGGGLRIFREFFPEARLFGFEFDRKKIELVTRLGMEKTRIAFINVAEEDCITRAFEASGTRFDIIIDDSSHDASHQINVIRRCAPFLKPGGMLIIEDIYDDFRAPESLFEGVIREMHEQFSLATFIYPKNRRVNVEAWNNEKLLLLVKRYSPDQRRHDTG
jgi:SAM-dependent methyltransferase